MLCVARARGLPRAQAGQPAALSGEPRRHRILSRHLIDEVWDGAEVTDRVVTQSIFELRKILKDGRPDAADYIATVPKRGYKLVAPVRPLLAESVQSGARGEGPEAETTGGADALAPVRPLAGPLTRAISTRARDGHSRRRMIGFDIFVACCW